jgi:hypothetical protein
MKTRSPQLLQQARDNEGLSVAHPPDLLRTTEELRKDRIVLTSISGASELFYPAMVSSEHPFLLINNPGTSL